MPKPLFYAGIVFTLLSALMVTAEVVTLNGAATGFFPGGFLMNLDGGSSALRLIAFLLLSLPVAALFMRIASLTAPRDFFASLGAFCATTGTLVALASLVVLRLQGAWILSREGGGVVVASLTDLQQIDVAGVYVVAFFLSLAIFTFRSYFRFRGQLQLLLVSIPAPLFFALVVDDFVIRGGESQIAPIFLLSIAVSLGLIATHSLRHRHLFLEVTNLREILESRTGRRDRSRREGEGFDLDRGVAFDG